MFMLFVAAGMGLTALAHMAPFPFLLDALARGRSHWEMPRGEGAPRVYLTYDDGPNPTAPPALLDVLAGEGAVATFFLLDRHLDADTAPIVARMFDEGHAVALHSHTRRLMVLSPATFAQTLQAAADRSGGDIIVMHDGHHEDPRADRRYAVDATLRLVPLLRDQGFAFGTIC